LRFHSLPRDEVELGFHLLDESAPEGYILTMRHMNHYNFSDFPYIAELSPFSKSLVGDIAPARGGKIINDYVPAFFGKYQQSARDTLLAPDATHPEEVTFAAYNLGRIPASKP